MFNHSQTPELNCDCPPYSIVRACRMVGFKRPEDVRWCRLSQFRKGSYRRTELFSLRTWKLLLGMAHQPDDSHCSCGGRLPLLEKYTFTCVSGREIEYYLGQCQRCHTVFWE